MKRFAAVLALILVFALSGCSTSSPNIEDVAKARQQCHQLGGKFRSWLADFEIYQWECDLSDKAAK